MNKEKINQICDETVKEMREQFKSLDTRGYSDFERLQVSNFEEMLIRNVIDNFTSVNTVYEDFKGENK